MFRGRIRRENGGFCRQFCLGLVWTIVRAGLAGAAVWQAARSRYRNQLPHHEPQGKCVVDVNATRAVAFRPSLVGPREHRHLTLEIIPAPDFALCLWAPGRKDLPLRKTASGRLGPVLRLERTDSLVSQTRQTLRPSPCNLRYRSCKHRPAAAAARLASRPGAPWYRRWATPRQGSPVRRGKALLKRAAPGSPAEQSC